MCKSLVASECALFILLWYHYLYARFFYADYFRREKVLNLMLLLGDALFMLFQRIYLWLIKCLNPSQQHSCHGVLYYSDLDLIFKVTLVPILPKLGFHS